MRCFLFQHSVMTNPTIFKTLLRSNAYEFVKDFVLFLSGKTYRYRLSTHMLIFVGNIRPARTFWNSTHCLLNPFTLDWSRNLWHNPMWNMAVNNISYSLYPYITKMIPFFFCSVYVDLKSNYISPICHLPVREVHMFILQWPWIYDKLTYKICFTSRHNLLCRLVI